MNIKLGSLFDGIGGFPYAGTMLDINPVWASEIESFPIRVTENHFPNMKHLGDITQINGAEIEPVDIITFGSPCTRLSVAGRHDGFDIAFKCEGNNNQPHDCYKKTIRATDKYQYIYKDTCPICGKELCETNESALFFHAIRVIKEMRCATDGASPRFIVWENVPGAFSSNKGEDFRAVLEEITEAEIPMPRSGKWATAGMVRTKRVDVAWRVLDAQYWGVPQRRRRIFLVADFGGQCAGEILFEPRGNSWANSQTRHRTDTLPMLKVQGGGLSLERLSHCVFDGNDIRWLTPLERLRLMGFPAYWLDIEGMSDTAKYKAVGNSVAIPCVLFVLSGIANVLRRRAA